MIANNSINSLILENAFDLGEGAGVVLRTVVMYSIPNMIHKYDIAKI